LCIFVVQFVVAHFAQQIPQQIEVNGMWAIKVIHNGYWIGGVA